MKTKKQTLFGFTRQQQIIFWMVLWLAAVQAFELSVLLLVHDRVMDTEIRMIEHKEFTYETPSGQD